MPLAFALPVISSIARQAPVHDSALLAAAGAADALRKPRQVLRRARGREPPVLDAAAYAAECGLPVDPDPSKWERVFAARNELTVRWMWLVIATARKLNASYTRTSSSPMSLADMIQEGVCGLMGAVERYSPDHDCPFGMYAYFAIKHSIIRAVENQGRPVRLPVHVHNKLSRLRKARLKLEGNGLAPSVEEVAAEAGLAPADARLYLNRSLSIRSLDAPLLAWQESSTLYELLADPSADSSRQLEIACAREALAHLVHSANLEELELSVLTLKYGLADGVERLRSDVSRMLKVDNHKIRRAELKALHKLRQHLNNDTTPWAELLE